MYNLLSLEFLFFFAYSFFAIFLAIFIPGKVLLHYSKIKLPTLSGLVLPITVGIAAWVTQGFIFGFLDLRFLTYLYVILAIILWIIKIEKTVPRFVISQNWILAFLIILAGSIIQISFGLFTGVKTPKGLMMCCVDISDNLYFLSLSSEIVKNIPPFEPGLTGVIVKNYHYLSNIFIAELSRIFMIPLNVIQFQFSAVFLPTMLGLTVLAFSLSITKKIKYALWLLFFIYFGGDLIWMLMVILQKGTNYFSMGSLEDGTKFLSNPPRSFAIIQILGGLTLFNYWLERRNLILTLILGLVLGSLIGFKVYFGIFALFGILTLTIVWIYKKDYERLALSVFCICFALIFYLPVNKGAGGLYFTSFWFFENFIVQPYLQLERLELARRIFLDDRKFLKAFSFELLYMAIAVISLFGTKLLGLIQTRKTLKMMRWELHLFLLSGLVSSLIVGFFFQQTSGGSNTFNFLVNVFILGSIYTAITAFYLTSFQRSISIVIGITIIGLTIPRVVFEAKQNFLRLAQQKVAYISNNQLNSFEYMKVQPKGLVLIDHAYFELDQRSPYIHYFTQQPMYLSGVQILVSHGIETDSYLINQNNIFEGSATVSARILKNNNISYVVLGQITRFDSSLSAQFLREVYKNKEVKVLRVDTQKIDTLLKENEGL